MVDDNNKSIKPDKIYYEPDILEYQLGKQLKEKFKELTWIPIKNHNNIEELRKNPNTEFAKMKRHIIIGTRKTLKYTPNHKVSDFLVPYTSSGCSAMCLYCYLVCNYNKCSYLRLFVNREKMLNKIKKTAQESEKELVFEIGSNSDLILENTITNNLIWTIEEFSKIEKGFLTFPTKFNMIDPLLTLNHKGKIIIRVSVNPNEIIKTIEYGTSSLTKRIEAINKLCEAGYRVGILIAPIVMTENWKSLYKELIEQLSNELSNKVKKQAFIEIIFMTYSYVHRAINTEAFPNSTDLYNKSIMTGRGRGKYCYKENTKVEAEEYIRNILKKNLNEVPIIYIV